MMRSSGNARKSASQMSGRLPRSSAVTTRRSGEDLCTESWISASSATSPTISIHGCSASVSSSNSRINLGLLATKILNVLTIVTSPGEPVLAHKYESKDVIGKVQCGIKEESKTNCEND